MIRATSSAMILGSGIGFGLFLPALAVFQTCRCSALVSLRSTISSSQVFQLPQAGHLPNHLGSVLPHSVHANTFFTFAKFLFFY
jgi:hypothetical protein